MKDNKEEFPWEVLPWSAGRWDYAIWIKRHTLKVSNQNDCNETISFHPDDLADLDEFIGRLQEARKWLAGEQRQTFKAGDPLPTECYKSASETPRFGVDVSIERKDGRLIISRADKTSTEALVVIDGPGQITLYGGLDCSDGKLALSVRGAHVKMEGLIVLPLPPSDYSQRWYTAGKMFPPGTAKGGSYE